MLDSQTKSRIDSARDILVGKVPDPKSQVEQITIALIYKFMDDMDRQSEELGGKATFFTGEFKKYRWAQLLDKRYGGHERLLLYAEGIEKMNENKNIPQLFRDIFKGVFLPYRDPETLNLFLKEINGFSYDHSERLGDAFEYLLSVLGTQGDAGQFRTPRHIIDFIVAVVNPKKDETILDPACGTAGFLISAYKHIMNCGLWIADCGLKGEKSAIKNQQSKIINPLSPDERARLMTNFRGYDIAPDMVRLARANMYLHGFPNPTIHEYDALTSEERWDERCDVILANPPFMTPKGGVRPHNRFSIKAKRSEVLFVDYIAEHLNPGGRAGIIVPEGVIFQGGNAYKQLRRMLVENYLWAVVSLPAGVFNPYSGVKTSILFLDKNMAKRASDVLFVKIENDGFDLGAQRRANGKSELPGALSALKEQYLNMDKQDRQDKNLKSCISCTSMLKVPRARLLESPDVNLSGDRYRVVAARHTGKWPMVKLGDESLFSVVSGGTPSSTTPAYWNGDVNWATLVDLPADQLVSDLHVTQRRITSEGLKASSAVLLPKRSILVSTRATIGRIAIAQVPVATNQGFKNVVIQDFDQVSEQFVAYMLSKLVPVMDRMASGGTFKEISKTNFCQLEIPLPPLDEQERIVAELEGYRKVIDGARQILAAYKPTIRIDPEWPVVKLGEVCDDFQNGANFSKEQMGYGTLFVNIKDLFSPGYVDWEQLERVDLTAIEVQRKLLKVDDLLFVRSSVKEEGVGFPSLMSDCPEKTVFCGFIIKCSPNKDMVLSRYLLNLLRSVEFRGKVVALSNRANITNISQDSLKSLLIPLPPLAIQQKIVDELEAERKLVEASRELITRMEVKIKDKLAEVWGETGN